MDKFEMVEKLDKLPADIANKAYRVELIEQKVKMQYNKWLKDKYRIARDLSGNEKWFVFRIGEWYIKMETKEENHLHPVMGKILNDFEKEV